MGVRATDNFNRADNSDLGANWSVAATFLALEVSGNACVPSNLNDDNVEYYSADTPPADQYAQCKVTVTANNPDNNFNGMGPACRISTSAKTLYVATAVNDRIKILEGNAGSFSMLGSFSTTWVDGDTLRLECNGSSIKAFINGVERISATDSTIASGRYGIGYGSTVTAASVDDWEGGDFEAAGGTTLRFLLLLGVGA